jgi:hypothetical protein
MAVVVYKIKTSGFDMSKPHDLYNFVLGVDLAPRIVEKFLPVDGRLYGSVRGGPLENYEFAVNGFQRGLALEVMLTAGDGTAASYAKVFPNPIESLGGTCRVWLQLAGTDGATFLAYGDGFAAGEPVQMVSVSDDERLEQTIEVGPDGHFGPMLLNVATVAQGFKARFELKGAACSAGVDYNWGPKALEAP